MSATDASSPTPPDRQPPDVRVRDFVARHNLQKPAAFAALDLAAEAGEVAKAILSATRYGRDAAPEAFARARAELDMEIGDTLFSLLDLANTVGVDADAALDAALARYAARIRVRGTPGSGAR